MMRMRMRMRMTRRRAMSSRAADKAEMVAVAAVATCRMETAIPTRQCKRSKGSNTYMFIHSWLYCMKRGCTL